MIPGSFARLASFFALSAAGGVAAYHLGLPVPFMFGAALVSVFLGIVGFAPRRVPSGISFGARAVIGVLIGASLNLNLLDRLPEITLAAVLVPVQVALVLVAGSTLLRYVAKMTPSERLLGSLPGGFAAIVLSVEELGHDVRRITMYHAIRVFTVVTVIPLVLAWGLSLEGAGVPVDRAGLLDLSFGSAATFLGLAVVGGLIAWRIPLPASPILVPLALAVAVELLIGLPDVPREATPAAQIVLGALVGSRFAEGGIKALRNAFWTGILLTAVVLAASLAPVSILVLATDLPLALCILAFAPGGLPEISVLALSLDLDPALVVAIHVWRMAIVLSTLPFLLKWMEREDAAAREKTDRGPEE